MPIDTNVKHISKYKYSLQYIIFLKDYSFKKKKKPILFERFKAKKERKEMIDEKSESIKINSKKVAARAKLTTIKI